MEDVDGTTMDLKSQLERDSYIIVDDVFEPSTDFSPLYDEWGSVLDDIAAGLTAGGALTAPFDRLPFEQRLVAVTEQSGQHISGHFDISLPQHDIRPDTPVCASPAVFRLLTKDRLLDVVEELIGPEITSNPTQHVRMKLPERVLADRRDGLSAERAVPPRPGRFIAGSRRLGHPDLLGGHNRRRRVERLPPGLPPQRPRPLPRTLPG